jgi:tRNA threonylcarbamoyladenosine biosynthesis protein TsaB
MLLLAADTSGKLGSLALLRCQPDGNCEAVEIVAVSGGTFSAQMVPQIAALLGRNGAAKTQIDGFAVVSGPGSFTGLRVGLAAIKALAEILQKPIAAVSLLEAIALTASEIGQVFVGLDAGRKEIYAAEYDIAGGTATRKSEQLVSQVQFAESVRGRMVITPDDIVAEAARVNALEVRRIARPQSDGIGKIGWKKILSGDTVSAEALDANYIRRSDAEIFSSLK